MIYHDLPYSNMNLNEPVVASQMQTPANTFVLEHLMTMRPFWRL